MNDISGFYEFVKALNEINPDRNLGHTDLSLQPRDNQRPNNFINLNNKLTSIQPPYFDDISKSFSIVINWLKQNNLWKIDTYDISQFKQVNLLFQKRSKNYCPQPYDELRKLKVPSLILKTDGSHHPEVPSQIDKREFATLMFCLRHRCTKM